MGSCQDIGHRAIGPGGSLRGAVGGAGAQRGRFADAVTPGPVGRSTPFAPGGGSGEPPAWSHHARTVFAAQEAIDGGLVLSPDMTPSGKPGPGRIFERGDWESRRRARDGQASPLAIRLPSRGGAASAGPTPPADGMRQSLNLPESPRHPPESGRRNPSAGLDKQE